MNCENCKNYEKKEDVILAPEPIQFTRTTPICGMGLKFNNGKQELCFNHRNEAYRVGNVPSIPIPTKLIPCKKEDIGLGEWAFGTDFPIIDRNLNCKSLYLLRIKKNVFAFIEDDLFIYKSLVDWRKWYKVVAV